MLSPADPTQARAATRPGQPLHLRVFIASPGDVTDEREIARRELEQLPYDALVEGGVKIDIVAWDQPGSNTPMRATMTPSAAIAKGLPRPSECDIVLVIFWSRMGTPIATDWQTKPDGSPFRSGTEWEFLDALNAAKARCKPEVLVYRRTEARHFNPEDPAFDADVAQWKSVKAFFNEFTNHDGSQRMGYNAYATPEDFRGLLHEHLRRLISEHLRQPTGGHAPDARRIDPSPPPPKWQSSPFPGLRAFTPADAPIFFGRGREVDDLIGLLRIEHHRFLLIAGASGSGKSSLVGAGLIPRLRDNALPGSKDWLLPDFHAVEKGGVWTGLRFTPGELDDNPFRALAAKLSSLLSPPPPVAALTTRITSDQAHLSALITKLLVERVEWSEVFLFIDQFEELLTNVHATHRERFIGALMHLTEHAKVRIVATMRGDFFARLVEEYPALTDLLRRGASYPLANPGIGALGQMIERPAARAGLILEDNLAQRMLDDTASQSGGLALLAFALHELYKAGHQEGRLTHRHYEGFGTVKGAISTRAESIFNTVPAQARNALPQVFSHLVEVDDRGTATRRRAGRHSVDPQGTAAGLIDAFIDARLLVSDRGADGESVVEVAHEALLREWPRLADWIRERADDFRVLRQIEAAAKEWERAHRDVTHPWPQERLAPVYDSLARLGLERGKLAEPTQTFIRPEAERLLLELEVPTTTHQRRAEIGDRLDRIGDPRPGIGLRKDGTPDIVLCEVPPGEVEVEDGRGQFKVGRFHMAIYPVTYAQYKAFVDDPRGYKDRR